MGVPLLLLVELLNVRQHTVGLLVVPVMIPVSLHVHVDNGQKLGLLGNHLDVLMLLPVLVLLMVVLLTVLKQLLLLLPLIVRVLHVQLDSGLLLVIIPIVPLLLLVEINSHAGPVSKSMQLLQPQIVPVLLVPMVLMLLPTETVANVPLFPVLPLSPVLLPPIVVLQRVQLNVH